MRRIDTRAEHHRRVQRVIRLQCFYYWCTIDNQTRWSLRNLYRDYCSDHIQRNTNKQIPLERKNMNWMTYIRIEKVIITWVYVVENVLTYVECARIAGLDHIDFLFWAVMLFFDLFKWTKPTLFLKRHFVFE
jgi:hypothetical protein